MRSRQTMSQNEGHNIDRENISSTTTNNRDSNVKNTHQSIYPIFIQKARVHKAQLSNVAGEAEIQASISVNVANLIKLLKANLASVRIPIQQNHSVPAKILHMWGKPVMDTNARQLPKHNAQNSKKNFTRYGKITYTIQFRAHTTANKNTQIMSSFIRFCDQMAKQGQLTEMKNPKHVQ